MKTHSLYHGSFARVLILCVFLTAMGAKRRKERVQRDAAKKALYRAPAEQREDEETNDGRRCRYRRERDELRDEVQELRRKLEKVSEANRYWRRCAARREKQVEDLKHEVNALRETCELPKTAQMSQSLRVVSTLTGGPVLASMMPRVQTRRGGKRGYHARYGKHKSNSEGGFSAQEQQSVTTLTGADAKAALSRSSKTSTTASGTATTLMP